MYNNNNAIYSNKKWHLRLKRNFGIWKTEIFPFPGSQLFNFGHDIIKAIIMDCRLCVDVNARSRYDPDEFTDEYDKFLQNIISFIACKWIGNMKCESLVGTSIQDDDDLFRVS